MSLGPGQRLGPYEVLGPLGAGGMGEVWRARDTRLGRDVALKVLPDDLAGSAERRSRLEHEARLLASLNHPSIAALHDVLDYEGSPVLVMEVIEGETLAERLSRGPLALKTALTLALPIAEALEAAHERGILHRDLKPSNVKLTPDGGVKVLDFGLAKVLEREDGEILSAAATMPKLVEKTESGVAVGTAPYMSPEQARGEPVGKRTDVWAFGCILFEMLTGRRAFPGATRSDSIAAVLSQEPDWGSLPSDSPLNLQRVLKRCLQKDQRERLRDIADTKFELRDLLVEMSAGRTSRPQWKSGLAATAVLIAIATAALWLLRPKAPPATHVRMPRFQLSLPRGRKITEAAVLAISPDGSQVAFQGWVPDSTDASQLYVRDRSEIDARPLPGTEDASDPLFSSDGRWIAFAAKGQLKKVNLDTGAIVVLAEGLNARAGSWGEDGSILLGRNGGGLLRVRADGGEVREVTKLDPERQESGHYWPHLLPGGGAVLFAVRNAAQGMQYAGSRGYDVAIVDLETGTKRILVESASCPKYVGGHVLFGRDGIVYAAPLDLDRLELRGSPVPVLEGVAMWSSPGLTGSGGGVVNYDVSQNGDLLFTPREASLPQRTLVLLDRQGRRQPASSARRAYVGGAYFSPDGRRIAASVMTNAGDLGAFVLDITSDAWRRVGGDAGWASMAWAPDGKSLFLNDGSSVPRIVRAPVDGSAPPQTVYVGPAADVTVAQDGSALFISIPGGVWDIWHVPLTVENRAAAWLATPINEGFASPSPDGRWVAFKSIDSGREEIYVRASSGSGGWYQVSTQGGNFPRWSRDGREIFFSGPDDMSLWAAAVRASPTFASDSPRKLFDWPEELLRQGRFHYDVSLDSQHFVMIEKDPVELRPVELVVIPGWVEEMKSRLAAAK